MKILFLNELSISPLAKDFHGAWERIHNFIITYKARPKNIFENRICSDQYLGYLQITPDLKLQDFCIDPKGRTLGNLLLGLTRHPYIDPESPQENGFLESQFTILKDSEKIPTNGLAAAFLHDSIGISFLSENFWKEIAITLFVERNSNKEIQTILSVSVPFHFQCEDFLQWQDAHTPIEIIPSPLSYKMKRIHLRDDHGSDILTRFAKKLIRSPYVVEVVNSIQFNPHERQFIKEIKDNGLIELVLASTDEGLGLVVKTSGRNLRETKYIASILNKEFGS
jgi:hypothetical protein